MGEALRREVRPFGIRVSLLCRGRWPPIRPARTPRPRTELAIAEANAPRGRARGGAVCGLPFIRGACWSFRGTVLLAWSIRTSAGMADWLIYRFYVARLRAGAALAPGMTYPQAASIARGGAQS
jgi:hypothetical protein